MNLEETRKRILEDESFIISECHKIQTLYGLKKVIRYGMNRSEKIDTESVAEHIFAMSALAEYFLPLVDESGNMNKSRILSLTEFHDIDEIVTGDYISFTKTTEQVAEGKAAVPIVIARLPESMQESVTSLLNEYEAQETKESQFVKAIDKIEPSFHVYSENGMKINHNVTGVSYADHRRIKDPYTEKFPLIHRFSDVLSRALRDQGFFSG